MRDYSDKLLMQIASILARIERKLDDVIYYEEEAPQGEPIWSPNNLPDNIWEHYCEVEHATIGVGKNEKCSWCGKTKEEYEN